MADFKLHDETTAPAAAGDLLAKAKASYGMIPSLLAVLAENPAALETYMTVSGIFDKCGLDPLERQVVLIATSVENECHYCVAAHSAISAGQSLDMDVINALRENRPIANAKLDALRSFTRKVVTQRGFVSDSDVATFMQAGYDQAAVLGVILGVSLKTLSNYTNHVAETPVDAPFEDFAWTPPKREVDAAE